MSKTCAFTPEREELIFRNIQDNKGFSADPLQRPFYLGNGVFLTGNLGDLVHLKDIMFKLGRQFILTTIFKDENNFIINFDAID